MSEQDRRLQARAPARSRALLLAPPLELPCLITDTSGGGLRIQMDRGQALSGRVLLVDLGQAVAIEADVAWCKGREAGLKRRGQASLRGLVPARFAAARAAFLRAGGR